MKIVLLLGLVGLALCQPISYEYRYTANVATGAIEVGDQLSGVQLVANVRVSISGDKKKATIRIMDPMVGFWNEFVPGGRTPLPSPPGNLQPMKEANQIEKPFVVTFSGSNERLQVPSGDTLWMVNLRKGIASTLRVPYVFSTPGRSIENLSQNRISSSVQFPTSYQKQEETMHGKCLVRYTIFQAYGNTRTPDEYRLIKSIDFDACNEQIVLTKSSQGNLTAAGAGQDRGVQSRSSVGTYLLKGSLNSRFSARVEEAVIEGIVTLNPMGHNTKKLVSITNQTLTLMTASVQEPTPEPRPQDLKPEIWTFRMQSPHTKAVDSPAWISFLNLTDVSYPIYPVKDMLGFALTDKLRQQLKKKITQLVSYVVNEITKINEVVKVNEGTKDGQMVRNITYIVRKLRDLPFRDLEELFHQIAEQPGITEKNSLKRNLLIHAYRSTGSSSPFKVLIKKLKDNALSYSEALSIFRSMNVGASDPVMVSELIDYALTRRCSNVTLKAALLVNLATLTRRLCVLESARDFVFFRPVFGGAQCAGHVAAFARHLIEQLQKSTKSSSRAIYIQSLANLGDMEGLKVLAQVAKGIKYSADKNMQLLAINGLTKNHLKNSSYEFTRDVLVSIVENQDYRPEVREVALVSLFTLPQNASMWQRIALNTWRDTSKRVSMFIHSYIKAVAESRNPHFIHKINIARHVLPLTKRFKMISLASKYWSVSDYSISQDLGYQIELVNAIMHSSSTPLVIQTKFLAIAGGLKFPVLHYSMIGELLKPELWRSVKEMFFGMLGPKFRRHPQYRQGVTYLQELTYSEQLIHFTFFKDIEIFVPITGDHIQELLNSEQSRLAGIIGKLMMNEKIQSLTSMNIVDEFEFIPSDIGVPITIEIVRPLFVFQEIHLNLQKKLNTTKLEGKSVSKLVFGNEAVLSMLVPWTNQTISVEVHGETSVNLPVQFSAELDVTHTDVKVVDFGAQIVNVQGKPVPVAVTYIQPFTAIRPLIEVVHSQLPPPIQRMISYEPIPIRGKSVDEKIRLPLPGFINITLQVCGFNENPFQAERLQSVTPIDVISALVGPTIEHYQIAVLYTPPRQDPPIKLAGRIMYAAVPKTLSVQQGDMIEDAPMIEDMSVQDTVDQRMQKMRKSPASRMVSASMKMEGSRVPMMYEFVTLLAPQHIVREQALSSKKFNVQMNFLKNTAQNLSSQVCLRSSLKWPLVEQSKPMSQLLTDSMPIEMTTKMFNSGQFCRLASHDLSVKARVEMSQERRERLVRGKSAYSQTFKAVKPVYDTMIVEVEKIKSLNPMIERAIQAAHSIFNPNQRQTPPVQAGSSKLVKLTGQRSLRTDLLTVRMQSQHGAGERPNIRVPSLVDALAPVSAL